MTRAPQHLLGPELAALDKLPDEALLEIMISIEVLISRVSNSSNRVLYRVESKCVLSLSIFHADSIC